MEIKLLEHAVKVESILIIPRGYGLGKGTREMSDFEKMPLTAYQN